MIEHVYDHLISIGMNCEIRYQLKQKFGAIDSSLLEWAVVPPTHLVEVLKNPHLIFSGEIEEKRAYNMWHCKVTDITFHGKKTVNELLGSDGKPDEAKIAQEKEDTIARIGYLTDKFLNVAHSEDSKLYILGIHPDFCKYKGKELRAFIQNVSDAIQNVAKNASLLVISLAENVESLKDLNNDKNLFIRPIHYFAPYNQATNPEYVDLQRGKELLSEFKPKNVKEDTKVYKFEKDIHMKNTEHLSEKDIKILVSYHKPSVLLKNEILTPIHAGRAIAQKPSKDGAIDFTSYQWLKNSMIGDDTGDNISEKNRFYNEVTSIYWAWKNRQALDNPKYVGFMHYRRQFIFDDSKQNWYVNNPWFAPQSEYKIYCLFDRDLPVLFSEDQIVKAVNEADVLIAKPAEYNISVFEQYANDKREHVLSDLECVLEVIDEKFPEYSESAKEYMNSYKHYFWNMFVMRWNIFDDYCKFLFGIFFEMEKRIDISDRNIIKQRIYAYLAERVTGIYITQLKKKKNISIKEKYSLFEEYTDIPQEIQPSFKQNNVPVIFSSDNNYVPYLAVAIKSLICNSSPEKNYDIFVIDEHITENNKQLLKQLIPENTKNIRITFIDVTPYLKGIKRSIFYCHGHFSISTYYRFFIPRILKNFDKAVYLDCDIVVLSDIAKLYETELDSHIIGAVKDVEVIRSAQKGATYYLERMSYFTQKLGIKNPNNYFQAGVLLLNLAKMRQENFEEKCINKLIEVKTPGYVDQDILNSVYENQVKFLPMNWNIEWQLPIQHQNLIEMLPAELFINYMNGYTDPFIIHYCSIYKPWKSPNLPLAKHFWKYARLTPFYEEILFRHTVNSQPTTITQTGKSGTADDEVNMLRLRIKKAFYSYLAKLTWGGLHKKYEEKKKKYKEQIKTHKKTSLRKWKFRLIKYRILSILTFGKLHKKFSAKKKEAKAILGIKKKEKIPFLYRLFCFLQPFKKKEYYVLFDNLHDVDAECLDAYTLFRYMQRNNIPCRYIVNKQNRLFSQISRDKDVIAINGKNSLFKELFNVLLKAKSVIASSYNQPQDDKLLQMNPDIEYIYLDHGVVFFNDACTHRYTPKYFNKLIIKNNIEKEIFIKKAGWKAENLISGGLPRWDNLKPNKTKSKKEIFMFFTWRGSFNPDYLDFVKKTGGNSLTLDNFEYFKKIKSLLNNKKLNALSKKYNIEFCYGVHHALLDICKIDKELFKNPNIRLAEIGNISKEVKQASMLITDYSSIAFDFMYQNKPCLFYRMDFNDKNLCIEDKANLDNAKEKDIFVYNCLYNEDDVINKIEFYIKNNFQLENVNAEKNLQFFYYKQQICKKIVDAIIEE